jgi:lysophospholipase L1-like esterase
MIRFMRAVSRRILGVFRACRAAWMILGLTIVFLMVMEWGLSALFWVKDRRNPIPNPDPRVLAQGYGGATWPVTHYQEITRLGERWEPFVYFRQKPFSGQTIRVGSDGLRVTWAPPASAGKPTRIWVMGGSCTWGFGARDEETIPSHLARKLHEQGHAVEVRNFGELGYVSTQEVVELLRALQAGERPEVVVFYDGINDLASALLENQAGVSTNEVNRKREFNLLQSPPRLLIAGVVHVVQKSATLRLAQSIRTRLGLSSGPSLPASRVDQTDRLADDVIRLYAANQQLAEALGRAYGFRCLFFWQPSLFSKPKRAPFEEEERRKYAWLEPICRGVTDAMPKSPHLRDRPAFHDLARLFDDDSNLVYIDYCHTTESANARLADVIAQAVVPLLNKVSDR